jgi:hypothetical protein
MTQNYQVVIKILKALQNLKIYHLETLATIQSYSFLQCSFQHELNSV